ncbi:MAG TPA: NUDIX domain-containing protein [Syntrophales bacterium]|nr:NUDIX domain-containing protein [Syntrophales bacterium]
MIWEHSAGIIPYRNESGKRKYLLLLSGLTRSELWEFPKGLIEKGEKAEEAAIREFVEETGIRRLEVVPGFKSTLKYFYRRKGELIGKTVTYFLGRTKTSRVILSSEAKDYAWVEIREAKKKIRHKNILSLVTEAEEYLQSLSGVDSDA